MPNTSNIPNTPPLSFDPGIEPENPSEGEEDQQQEQQEEQKKREHQWANNLRREQQKERRNPPQKSSDGQKNQEMPKELKDIAKQHEMDSSNLPKSAQQLGEHIGEHLRQKIMQGSFTSFIIAMCLAALKDVWDLTIFVDLGFLAMMMNIIVTAALIRLTWFQGIWLKRLIVRKLLGRIIIVLIAELIPGVNLFPAYTIGVLMIKHEANKHERQARHDLTSLETVMKKIRMPRRTRA